MATRTRIGILCEEKVPPDRRVPFTPAQLQEIQSRYPQLQLVVAQSPRRCFTDESYRQAGFEVVADLSDCDVLFGVKEVPIEKLLPEKTYLFFSHTAKEQPYNRRLLQEILRKRIRLIDYEYLTNEQGHRQVAFGRYAGIVGAHNALWAYGERTNRYQLPRAKDCHNYAELLTHYKGLSLPPFRVVVTGTGRVGGGIVEVLSAAGLQGISPQAFLEATPHDHPITPTYTQLGSADYHELHDHHRIARAEKVSFHDHPELFRSTFLPYAQRSDILVAGAYWDANAPMLFTAQEAAHSDFSLRVISDVTCDIKGSIPATKRPSTIADPLYGYDPRTDSECALPPVGETSSVLTVCAVDNLPCELPVDASHAFGEQLLAADVPRLCTMPHHPMIMRATIAAEGRLTPRYAYLQRFVNAPANH